MIRLRVHARLPRLTWPVLVAATIAALCALLLDRHGFGLEPRCVAGGVGGGMQFAVVRETAACAQGAAAPAVNSAVVVLAVLALPVLLGYLLGVSLGCWLSILVRAGLRKGLAGAELIARHVLQLVRPTRMAGVRVLGARRPRRRRIRERDGASAPGYGTVQTWRGPPRVAVAVV